MNAFLFAASLLLLVQETAHDRAFFRAIVEGGYRVPKGEAPAALIRELSGFLGSPDRELRDEFAYSIPTAWIYREKLLGEEELRGLLRAWSSNLKVGLGQSGDDSVLLRSFSALDLSVLAALDNERPFMRAEEFRGLLADALSYLAHERDVRGYESRVGWIHSAAHTADLLKFLSRNTKLEKDDQRQVVAGIAAKLATAGSPFTHGEDERLARALLSIVRHSGFEATLFDSWISSLDKEQAELFSAKSFDHDRFVAVQNQKNALRCLFTLLSAEKDLSVEGRGVQGALLRLLTKA